jgi:hypothetical protein
MAKETVHNPRPVKEFLNDASPWFEGGRRVCAYATPSAMV